MKYQYSTNSLNVIKQATLIEEIDDTIKYFLPFENQTCKSIQKAVFELLDFAATKDSEEENLIYLAKLIAILKEPYIIDIFQYKEMMEELDKLKRLIITEISDISFNISGDY